MSPLLNNKDKSQIKQDLPTSFEILTKLYTKLSPRDGSLMTQLILRDIRPNLYPIDHTMSSIRSLLHRNSKSRPQLSLEKAMDCWHWSLGSLYKIHNNFESSCKAVESIPRGNKIKIIFMHTRIVERFFSC